MSYSKELRIASLAIQRACILTQRVFTEKVKGTISKNDKSPVTIGDFGAQALINQAVKYSFPDDEIVAEEEASLLRDNHSLRDQVWKAVSETHLDSENVENELGGSLPNADKMLEAIDSGSSTGGSKGRIWTLDPIDGTKGFLRGGQYAVCLALIVDGKVKVGALGCPNLPVDDTAPLSADVATSGEERRQRGVLFAAVIGEGATSQPLGTNDLLPSKTIFMKNPKLEDAKFCEGVEAEHSAHGDNAAIAKALGITKHGVRMDSQAKYGSVARGAGDIYLRLPMNATYEEKIWDHAAGALIAVEAGAVVIDSQGNELDFGQGRTLSKNRGVIVAPKALREQVIHAVKSVLSSKGP